MIAAPAVKRLSNRANNVGMPSPASRIAARIRTKSNAGSAGAGLGGRSGALEDQEHLPPAVSPVAFPRARNASVSGSYSKSVRR
jgi:hypothetical protein